MFENTDFETDFCKQECMKLLNKANFQIKLPFEYTFVLLSVNVRCRQEKHYI